MRKKWSVLSDELSATGVYAKERIEAKLIAKRFYSAFGAMRETGEARGDRTIKAFGALWPTWSPAYWEIGTLFVLGKYRGNGLLREIFDELIQRAPKNAHLFLITKEDKVMQLALERGFIPVTTETHPDILSWASLTGIVSRLPKSVHPVAPGLWGTPKAGERWLFMREGT